MAKRPPCPACKTNKQVRVIGVSGDLFKCERCGGMFDSDSSEGGDYSSHNPAARLEREERNRNQHQLNRRR